MDEPFVGLDPVNVALLKEAFGEMRERGSTLIFSTHQMEMVEELCEAVALIDKGRLVLSGPIREVRRSTGRRVVRLALEGRALDSTDSIPWLDSIPGVRIARVGQDYAELEVPHDVDPGGRAANRARTRRAGHELPDRRPVDRGDLHRPSRAPARARGGEAPRGFRGGCDVAPASEPPRPARGRVRRPDAPEHRAVARREILARIRTRAYRFTTVILVLAGTGLALAPTLIQLFDRDSTGDRIEIVGAEVLPEYDPTVSLAALLNSGAGTPSVPIPGQGSPPRYTVTAAPDLATARQDVVDGKATAALALARGADGDLAFELYSTDSALSRTNQLIRQAAISITIQDRLSRAGVPPVDQATLFNPPAFDLVPADPEAAGRPDPTDDPGAFLTGFGLSIAIFMAIILYGTWIAYGVAEEKSSRVMEIVLAAATPFQLLAGKVIGIGALALLQYVIVALPMLLVLTFQSQISSLILGTPAAAPSGPSLVSGISIGTVLVFGVMLVLGFAVYASLYAGAASLVSRQEDINQIVAPLTFVSVAGYLVSTYAGTGLIPLDSPLVVVLSFFPLFSPYLMLTRLSTGTAEGWEVVVAIVLLALTVPVALWIAARLYRSGVLMYGQAPSPRTLWRALRSS